MPNAQELPQGRTRSRTIDSANELQTLINSLTLDQLRFALSRLAPTKKIPLRKHAEALEALSNSGASVAKIAAELLHIEAVSPAKHCLVCSCPSSFDEISALELTTINIGEFSFRVCHVEHNQNSYSITFEHTVPVKTWVEEQPGLKRIKPLDIRHPIVFRYLKSVGAALFYFPGFFQGDGIKKADRISYETVCNALISGLQSIGGLKFGVVPIERAIGVLSEGENSRIKVTKSDVEGGLGRIGVSARAQNKLSNSVEDVITNFVSSHLPTTLDKGTLRSAIAKAFRDAPANSLVVHWLKEEIFSRINIWPIGAEFYFIWHETGQSVAAIEGIISTLFDISKQLIDTSGSSAWDSISKLQPKTIILPNNFAANHSLTLEQANKFFVKAITAGLITAVYRIRTSETLDETPNDWTVKLSALGRIFHTTSGIEIDGNDPSSIEVAFQRVGNLGERA